MAVANPSCSKPTPGTELWPSQDAMALLNDFWSHRLLLLSPKVGERSRFDENGFDFTGDEFDGVLVLRACTTPGKLGIASQLYRMRHLIKGSVYVPVNHQWTRTLHVIVLTRNRVPAFHPWMRHLLLSFERVLNSQVDGV
jgi:hypothetical protein